MISCPDLLHGLPGCGALPWLPSVNAARSNWFNAPALKFRRLARRLDTPVMTTGM
jgi:hypothetical protein